jgi:hypothetical protein
MTCSLSHFGMGASVQREEQEMAREDEFFKARGVIARQVRPNDGRRGALYEVELGAQAATHKDGRTVEIAARTTSCAPVEKVAGLVNLQDGARVIVLVDPRDPRREGRIIGARS